MALEHRTRERPADWWVFFIVSGWAVFSMVRRVTVPAAELGLRPYFGLFMDSLLLAALIGLNISLSRRDDGGPNQQHFRPIVAFFGIGAALIMVAIRLFDYEGWWSGHLTCCDFSR